MITDDTNDRFYQLNNIINVSRETFAALQNYVLLLLKWNQRINLISKQTEKDIWQRHILDSAQLISYIDYDQKVIDVGSGAGLPGIVLSILGVKSVVLIESDERKAIFLREAAKLSLNKIDVLNQRVEMIQGLEGDIVTSRAFASLEKTLSFIARLKINDKIVLLKGKDAMIEVKKALSKWSFDYISHDSITQPEAKILKISNLQSYYDANH